MCYEMHQYTWKLGKTATNATRFSSLMFLPLQHYADGVELQQRHQSQS